MVGMSLLTMHGNVAKWCKDWHDDHPSDPAIAAMLLDLRKDLSVLYVGEKQGMHVMPAEACVYRILSLIAQGSALT